jgi:hypothetical protein
MFPLLSFFKPRLSSKIIKRRACDMPAFGLSQPRNSLSPAAAGQKASSLVWGNIMEVFNGSVEVAVRLTIQPCKVKLSINVNLTVWAKSPVGLGMPISQYEKSPPQCRKDCTPVRRFSCIIILYTFILIRPSVAPRR